MAFNYGSALMAHYPDFKDKKYRPLNQFKGRKYYGAPGGTRTPDLRVMSVANIGSLLSVGYIRWLKHVTFSNP